MNWHVHTTASAFSELEYEWTSLARLSNQMICMSPGWAASWWKHFGQHKKRSLFIVTVYDNLQLVAIFPFYKGVTNIAGFTIQKRLQLIGSGGSPNEQLGFNDDYGISDFLDVIVDPEYRTRVAELLAKFLTTPEISSHQTTFHQARDDSFIMQSLYPLLKDSMLRVQAECTDTCYYIEIKRDADLQDFIKKSKSNARRRFRKTLRARGVGNEFVIEEPKTLADVNRMIGNLINMHQDRWNEIGFPGAFQDKRFISFFKEITLAAYEKNQLWLRQAVDKEGVCAVRMLLIYNGRFYDYMSGYDGNSPSAKFRPGIALLLDVVESSFELPINQIELLRGDEDYKRDFTDQAQNNWKITVRESRRGSTGWGIPAEIARCCSILFKHVNREIALLMVQYRKSNIGYMLFGYIKFRKNNLLNKLRKIRSEM